MTTGLWIARAMFVGLLVCLPACSGPAPHPAADAPPAAATPTATGIAAVSCDDFTATLAGLDDRFAKVSGPPWDYDFLDGGDHDYDTTVFSTLKMANADLCTVTTWGPDAGVDFACRWRQTDEAAAKVAAQALVNTLLACRPELKAINDTGEAMFLRRMPLDDQAADTAITISAYAMRWPPGGFSEAPFGGEKDLDAWIARRNTLAAEASQNPSPYFVTYAVSSWEKPCTAVDRLIGYAAGAGKLYGVAPDEIDSTSIDAIDPCMTGWTRRDLPIDEPLSESFPDDKGVPMTVTHPYIKAVEYTGAFKGKPTRLRAYADDNGWVWLDATPN